MRTVTWAPGTNSEYDALFDQLREVQYNDRSHRLWKNYDRESFQFAVALTIHFDDDDIPELCSSISNRDCWPSEAYRILNRAWKPNNKKAFLKKISDCMGCSAKSQINWLAEHTSCKLYFISRQTNNWDKWVIENFEKQFKLVFETDSYKYLTCPNECDDTCWQTIIYSGDTTLLNIWKRK